MNAIQSFAASSALGLLFLNGCTSGAMGAGGAGGGSTTAGTGGATTTSGAFATTTSGIATSSATSSVSSSSGAGGASDGRVPIFIAQGDMGRTIISCDDGKTWVGDNAWDQTGDPLLCSQKQNVRCWDQPASYMLNGQCSQQGSCLDTPDVAKGVIFGAGKFVATWGWGQPGAVRTSEDGITWKTTHPDDSFGGLAFGGGSFVVASRSPFTSKDGMAWSAGGAADFRNDDGSQMWSVRRFAYADTPMGGRFVAVASGDTNRDMLVSSDAGASWWRPTSLPADCAGSVSTYGGIVAGNGVILIVDQQANACRSVDGGQTWTVVPTGLTQILSHGVWTGKEFEFWGDDGFMISSPDGVTWTKTPMTTPTRLEPVARSESGTLVAVGNVWEGYEKQRFLRSTDGLTWEELPTSSFVQSHPIFYITTGRALPSAVCPAL